MPPPQRCGQLADEGDLLVPVERGGVGQDLHADVGAVAVHVRGAVRGKSCTKAAAFLQNIGMSGTFDRHHCGGEVHGQLVGGTMPVAAYASIIGMGRLLGGLYDAGVINDALQPAL